jgi:uncharacterized protein (UPF0333 family)
MTIKDVLNKYGTAGLKHTYYFMKDFTFTTTVSGVDRSTAVVTVNANEQVIWTCTLNKETLNHTTVNPIDGVVPVYGNVVIDSGATFTLTLPTATTNGNVVFNGVVTTNPDSQPFTFTLFSWPLNSSI